MGCSLRGRVLIRAQSASGLLRDFLPPLPPPLVRAHQDGRTALIQASWNGYPEVVKALVASGADLNAKNMVRDSGWMG